MATTDLGLSASEEDSSTYPNIRINASDGIEALYIKWHTDYLDNIEAANIAVSWRAVAKGDVPGGDGYSDWEPSDVDASVNGERAWYYRRFTASELWHSDMDEFGPGVWWAAPLSFTSTDPTTVDYKDIVQVLCGGNWAFSARKYDAINLCIKCRVEYTVDGVEGTLSAPLAQRDDIYIGYIPAYNAQSAEIKKEGLIVTYTSPNWARSTDRWALDNGLVAGGRKLIPQKTWGTLDAYGKILIPYEELMFDPSGMELSGTIRMNAVWRPIDIEFAQMSLDGIDVSDLRTANTPVLKVEADYRTRSVKVTVTDSGDKGVPLSGAIVRMVDGPYAFDKADVAIGKEHTFRFPPLGSVTRWEAVGYASSGAVSNPVVSAAAAIPVRSGADVLEPTDGSAPMVVAYKSSTSWSITPDVDTVKLAGRERPSAFFGEGGSASVSLSFICFPYATYPVVRQTIDDVRSIAMAGTCVLRKASGDRMLLAVTGLSYNEFSDHLSVSLSCEEVS